MLVWVQILPLINLLDFFGQTFSKLKFFPSQWLGWWDFQNLDYPNTLTGVAIFRTAKILFSMAHVHKKIITKHVVIFTKLKSLWNSA